MKTLKTQFRLNGLPYTLLKRNEVVALYGIGGTWRCNMSCLLMIYVFCNTT